MFAGPPCSGGPLSGSYFRLGAGLAGAFLEGAAFAGAAFAGAFFVVANCCVLSANARSIEGEIEGPSPYVDDTNEAISYAVASACGFARKNRRNFPDRQRPSLGDR